MIDRDRIIITYPVITNINDSIEDVSNLILFMEVCSKKIKIHTYRKYAEKNINHKDYRIFYVQECYIAQICSYHDLTSEAVKNEKNGKPQKWQASIYQKNCYDEKYCGAIFENYDHVSRKIFYLSGWKSGSNGMKCRKHALI